MVTNLPPSKIKITTTEKAITSINIDKKDLSIEEPKVQSSEQQISSFSQNESKSERPINATDTIELSEGTTQAKVDVPQHIIYMLLIGEWETLNLKNTAPQFWTFEILNICNLSCCIFYRSYNTNISCPTDRCVLSDGLLRN